MHYIWRQKKSWRKITRPSVPSIVFFFLRRLEEIIQDEETFHHFTKKA